MNDLARHLDEQLCAAVTARAAGADVAQLAGTVFHTSPPTSEQVNRMRIYLNGSRTYTRPLIFQAGNRAIDDRVGLRLLAALGLHELVPVWGPPRAELPPRRRAGRQGAMGPQGDTYHDRLARALAERVRELDVTYADLAVAVFGPKGRASQVLRYLDGTLTPLSGRGAELLQVLGLVDFKPVWGKRG